MKVYHFHFPAMGTRFDGVIPGIDEKAGESLKQSVEQEVSRLENMLTIYNPESAVSILNKKAALLPVKIEPELMQILKQMKHYASITNGLFDCGKGKQIQNLKKHAPETDAPGISDGGMHEVELDEKSFAVRFASKAVAIDTGGYGKGLALVHVQNLLMNLGVENAFISFGESTIYGHGRHPYGNSWKIEVPDVFGNKNLGIFELMNQTISTSANIIRTDQGQVKMHNHVINPQNGKAPEEIIVSSVVASSALDGEVLSTTFMLADSKQINEILTHFNEIQVSKFRYNKQTPEEVYQT